MASISPLARIIPAPSQSTSVTTPSPANDITTYVTHADGTISVTVANAQGEIFTSSTIPAPVSPASGAAGLTGAGGRAPGALLNLVA
jgi:hypothetical protein